VRDITLEIILLGEREDQIKMLNEQLLFKNRVVQAISDITAVYLGPLATLIREPTANNLSPIVHHFVQLTESSFGLLLQNPCKEGVHLQQKDLIGTEVKCTPAYGRKEFSLMEEVVGRAIATGKLTALDETHVGPSTLTHFLAVPLMLGMHVTAVLALGNRAWGFPTHLLEWLTPLFALATHLVSEMSLLQARVAAEEIERARVKAENENQAKSAFLAHMSHELRTPLSGVIGLLNMITMEQLSPEQGSYINMAKEASASLLIILNDILDLSAIEARELKLEEFSFDPRAVAEDVTRLLSFQADSKGVRLELSFEPSIPEQLFGDPTRLRQILLNLIGNAIKFTEHGCVRISFKGKDCPDSPNVFVLQGSVKPKSYTLGGTVEDTGIGMTPETMSGLFQSFSQGESSIARRFGGTGLGLFICKQLFTIMGGDIDATSEVSKGSIFQFSVRLRLPETAIPSKPVIVASEQRSKLPPLRVLVAEDNTVNQLILKSMLLASGCSSVTAAWNGVQAVELASAATYDVILMDVQMPIMDGIQATKRIRQSSAGHTVPIIGVTAHAMLSDREVFLASGMDACLVKPVNRLDLVEIIWHSLGRTAP